jgi:hypothetical protein
VPFSKPNNGLHVKTPQYRLIETHSEFPANENADGAGPPMEGVSGEDFEDKQAAKLKAKQEADKRIADKYIADPKAPPKRRKQKPVDDVVESVALDHPAKKI